MTFAEFLLKLLLLFHIICAEIEAGDFRLDELHHAGAFGLHWFESRRTRTKRNALEQSNRQWPHAVVPYEIHRSIEKRIEKSIMKAIDDFEKYTCIRWVPREHHEDYVQFVGTEDSCHSQVGRTGGKQKINLGRKCNSKGVALHEMMHTLGFHHEQCRPDRDKHVTILWENIKKDAETEFEIPTKYNGGKTTTLDEPYDFKSVMHYDSDTFSKHKGMKTIHGKVSKFGSDELSRLDIKKLRKYYKCNDDNWR